MDFDWDPAKASANVAKHRVDFEWAIGVFDDPWAIDRDELAEGEDRYNRIGMVANRLLVVTYTWRGETCRIISARLARSQERRMYHEA